MSPEELQAERDAIKAKLLLIRRYVIQHNGRLGGECVAWCELKKQFGIGQDNDADEVWMRQYTGRYFSLGL